MSDWALFVTVAIAHQLAMMSPGPDFAIATEQSLRHGRRAGVWVAAGIATGITLHLGYGLFGLGWLITRLPDLLSGLHLAGGCVLMWMGMTALRAAPAGHTPNAPQRSPHDHRLKRFTTGLTTNLFNPKAALFFVALFSSVLGDATSAGLRAALAAWITLTTFAWFAAVATFLTTPAVADRIGRHTALIERSMGVLLVALGIGMLWAGFPEI
jgi:threonine/homoserine/homoserine lactone efflux protein